MNGHPCTLFRFKALFLLLAPLILAGCEKGEGDPMEDMNNYYSANSMTLDNKPGSVKLPSTNTVAKLTVTPATDSVTAVGDTLVFTAAGGTPPYDWNVANVLIGSIQFKNGNPCVYLCKQLKQNSVWVTDHKGNVAAASVEVAEP